MEKNRIEKLLLSKNQENAAVINEQIALERRDVNFNYSLDGFYELANVLNEVAPKIGNSRITFVQKQFFDALDHKQDVLLIAGTGFGKSWLIVQKFVEDLSKKKETKTNYVHIVPNDILVIQSLREAKKLINEKDDVNVSEFFIPGKSNFIVVTPESFFGLSKHLETHAALLTVVIFDEAHLMSGSNPRSEFYKFICTQKISVWKKRKNVSFKRVFMSPFISDKEKFLKSVEISSKEISTHSLQGFESHFLIEDPETKKWFGKGEIIDANPVVENGVTLFYFSSAATARKEFEAKISNSVIDRNLFSSKLSKNTESKAAYDEIELKYGKSDTNSYDLFSGWQSKEGIGLYHSNQPNSMKDFTYIAAKNGLVKEIYATSAILNGVDLPIEWIKIDKAKESKKEMPYGDFMNLAGRAGRYSVNKNQILGKIIFDLNDHNQKWFAGKRKEILSRRKSQPSWVENDPEGFVVLSIKAAQNDVENEKAYYLDPRINPEVTKELVQNKDLAKKLVKISISAIKKSASNEKWNEEFLRNLFAELQDFFKLYSKSRASGWYDFEDWYPGHSYKQKAVKYFFEMFKYFSEEKHLAKIYFSHFKLNSAEHKYPSPHARFENDVRLYKNHSKYQLFMYFNHILEIAKYHKWIYFNLHDMYRSKSLDVEFVNYLAKENLVESYYLEQEDQNQKAKVDFDEKYKNKKLKLNLS